MVKAALVGLLTALLAISSGNLAAAQSTSVLATVAPAGSKVKAATTPAVVPKAAKATTTTTTTKATTTSTTTGTKATTAATTTAAAKTGTTTADTTKATTAPAAKTLNKSNRITPSAAAAVTPVPATKKLDKAKPVRDPLADTTPDDDTTTATTTKKSLTKSKSTGTTGTTTDATDDAAATPKKSLKKSSSTNTRVVVRQQPSNGEPNWIGPRVNAPADKACWRKAHRASTKCATGYALDKFKTACWAECPLEYPIQCGLQCLPQSKDCTSAFIDKIAPIANAALSTATVGVFGSITKSVQGATVALRCGKQLYDIVVKAVEYINDYEENKPATTKAALLAALKKSDIVAIDLPLGITTCLGLPIANAFSAAKDIVGPVEAIIEKLVTLKNKALEPKQFVSIATTSGVKVVSKMEAADVAELDQPVTCGGDLKGILDKVVTKVKELKEEAPEAPLDAIRLALSSTELVLVDIPKATKDCIPSGTTNFYEVRDQVRWAFQTIVDEVVNASTPSTASGAPLVKTFSKRDFAVKIAKMGLDILSTFEPTGFAALTRAYIQEICGPTEYFGEVDDGELKDSLGLNTIGKAFETSNGAYMKKGDGLVKINFISSDTKDVDVNIYSAGKSIANVTLETNKVVTWTKPMKELQDKTLYLDRWRPGLFTLPGKGGGSLVMWIPHSSQGGHVELHAVLNKS